MTKHELTLAEIIEWRNDPMTSIHSYEGETIDWLIARVQKLEKLRLEVIQWCNEQQERFDLLDREVTP